MNCHKRIPRGCGIRWYILLAASVLSCPGLALGQKPATFGESDKVAIEQLLDRYVRAYSAKDYAALRECIQAPFIRLPANTAKWDVLGAISFHLPADLMTG